MVIVVVVKGVVTVTVVAIAVTSDFKIVSSCISSVKCL